ncbi:hypothetical protein GQR58_027674 [Nymphon striatum]|nr:hypothetical protein GQR58_027674 [Nymphon striatum]
MLVKLLSSFVLLTSYVLCTDSGCNRAETYPDITTSRGKATCLTQSSTNGDQLFVCDPDSVLLSNHADNLNVILKNFPNKTGCICDICNSEQAGVKVYVAIVKTVCPNDHHTQGDPMRSMADSLRKRWSVGVCGDGILILLVQNNKKLYTSLGAKIKKYLTPNFTETYNKNIKFHTLGPYNVLIDAINDYQTEIQKVQKEMNKQPDPPVSKAGIIIGGIVGGIVAFVLVVILIVVFIKSGKMGDGRLGSIRKRRPKTDPDIKVRKTGSTYEPVATAETAEEKDDTKIAIDEDPAIITEQQTVQESKDEKPKEESPKENKKPEVPPKPESKSASSTPPPPPKPPTSKPPDDSEA